MNTDQDHRMHISRCDSGLGYIDSIRPTHHEKSEGKSGNDGKALLASSHGFSSSASSKSNDDDYNYYTLSKNPTVTEYILFVPGGVIHTLSNISRAFGWRFVVMVIIVYGMQQGLANSLFFFARDYYFKDVLQYDPSEAQTYVAASMTPWNIKPLYGMLSDSISIGGYHRIPYILLAGASGAISFTYLAILPLGTVLVVILMFFVNFSVASPDVMIDGVIAEKVKSHPKYATDLQSLCWGSQSLFSIIGHLTSGWAVKSFGSRAIFGGLVLSSVGIVLPSAMNWLGDVRDKFPVPTTQTSGCCSCCCEIFKINLDNFRKHFTIFMLAIVISLLALALTACALLIHSWLPQLCVVLSVSFATSLSVWVSLRPTLPDVAACALFIFLSNASTPDIGTAMFYWITDDPDGPQFEPPFMGYISAASFAAMFLGVLMYNFYFSSWSYKSIFSFSIVAIAIMSIFDVIIVQRWNLLFGIPDKLLALGDSALAPIFSRLMTLPMMVLAAKVCPAGAEATLFAMMMALSNFGGTVSVYLGALLLKLLDIEQGSFGNLTLAICIKTICRLSVLLLIPLLIPPGSPSDSSDEDLNVSVGSATGSSKNDIEMSNRFSSKDEFSNTISNSSVKNPIVT